jgi:glutamate carboxypeptidase
MYEGYVDYMDLLPSDAGPVVKASIGDGDKILLVLLHVDTVWPLDAPQKPPMQREGDILRGPGVFDMKANIVSTLFTFRAYKEFGISPDKRIVVLATPDEESGSLASRPVIESEARHCDACLVLETPLAGGAIKIRRKGIADMVIEAIGRAAHSGVNPQDGVNAIHELAHQIAAIAAYNDPDKGITVNVNTAGGGISRNAIPASARATIDIRAETIENLERVVAGIKRLQPHIPEALLHITGGVNRPPMVDNPESRRIAGTAQEIGRGLGMELELKSTGGGSDGSFTAAIGVPTVDGLGVDGAGAHTPDEHIIISRIVPRCTLFAELCLRI